MKRLFLKIFMWFWATAILTGFTLVLVVMLQHRKIHPEDHNSLAQTVRYFGTAAADITERNGSAAGSEYIKQLSHDVRIEACLFSETGKPISGERCDGFQKIVRGILQGDTSEFSMPNNIVRIAVPSHVTVVNAPDVSMIGDYSLLRSAIENVVRNAVRHTKPDTSVDIRLDAPTKADRMSATITVRDYGTGVSEEELANIFEPFYRVIDAENNDENGMGLGLSITDRVVRLHGGTTEAANAPGPGLLVTIRLPLSAPMG